MLDIQVLNSLISKLILNKHRVCYFAHISRANRRDGRVQCMIYTKAKFSILEMEKLYM